MYLYTHTHTHTHTSIHTMHTLSPTNSFFVSFAWTMTFFVFVKSRPAILQKAPHYRFVYLVFFTIQCGVNFAGKNITRMASHMALLTASHRRHIMSCLRILGDAKLDHWVIAMTTRYLHHEGPLPHCICSSSVGWFFGILLISRSTPLAQWFWHPVVPSRHSSVKKNVSLLAPGLPSITNSQCTVRCSDYPCTRPRKLDPGV